MEEIYYSNSSPFALNRLQSLQNSQIWSQKYFDMDIKNAKIDANSLSVGEVAKKLSEKDLKLRIFAHTPQNDEKGHHSFTFLYLFSMNVFKTFSSDSKSASNSGFLYPY
jgi:hypothetical protein